jgi:PTS system nitrogen regulatory IIA component
LEKESRSGMAAVHQSWKYLGGRWPGKQWKGSFDPKKLLKFLRQLFKKDVPVLITDYLDDRLVVFLQSDTQSKVVDELIEALDRAHQLKDKEQFHQAILDREKIVSTGIGLGLAIPHAKLPGYDQFFIAIGIQEEKGIEWNSLDGSQVHLIFMIGGPDNRQTEYLNILSRLTMAIKDSDRRKALLKATSARQVIDLFKGC